MRVIITTESNPRTRTFFIQKLVTFDNGTISISEFETEQMSVNEFEEAIYNTAADWSNYLKYSQAYNVPKPRRMMETYSTN